MEEEKAFGASERGSSFGGVDDKLQVGHGDTGNKVSHEVAVD